MSFEQKKNSGALFRNDAKNPNDDRDRDFSGTLDVEGAEYWISGWVKTSKAGKKYLSLSVKAKASEKPATAGAGKFFDDEICFAPEWR